MKKTTRAARTARFFHEGDLQADTELTLSKTASHHLVTVLRTRQGDVIELFNGDGYNYLATVVDTGQRTPGKRAILQLQDARPANSESPVRITLLQGISRGDRMDTSIRQSVELGVNHIQPLYTRHAAKALDEKRAVKKMEHWQAILVSACEQSARARLATLAPALNLEQWIAGSSTGESTPASLHTFVLDPTAPESLVSHLQNMKSRTPAADSESVEPSVREIGLIIGPESGLDADEIDAATSAGAIAVTIGPRILRTETAGPACIAMVQAILGDLE